MIKKLKEVEISRIAAGEVIQDPAGTIKELIENSLDAGADRIDLNIGEGGKQYIEINDNGSGIDYTDLPLVFERHATSKIATLADLDYLATMGFRGEALASLAAVSQVEVSTKTQDAEHAWFIKSSDIADIKPIKRGLGTTIRVDELFFRTPVRRKFLRSATAEYKKVVKIFNALAMSRLDVAFNLYHNQDGNQGKPALSYPIEVDSNYKPARLAQYWGEHACELAKHMQLEAGPLEISGWLGDPATTRSGGDRQMIYINGRYIRDRGLFHAVIRAYKDLMVPNRYPYFLLYIECDPASVDVNIHPSKEEVRFTQQDKDLVYQFVYKSVRAQLRALNPMGETRSILASMHHDSSAMAQDITIDQSRFRGERQEIVQGQSGHARARELELLAEVHPASLNLDIQQQGSMPIEEDNNSDIGQGFSEYHRNAAKVVPTVADVVVEQQQAVSEYPLGFALAQLHNIYILSQTSVGLIIVDMHAAHERIILEKLRNDPGYYPRQQLILPERLELTAEDKAILASHSEVLGQYHIDCEVDGDVCVINGLPHILHGAPPVDLVNDLLHEFDLGMSVEAVHQQVIAVLADRACKKAVKANRALSIAEMNSLLRQMEQTPSANQCNHGRPTWYSLSLVDLDKIFQRGH